MGFARLCVIAEGCDATAAEYFATAGNNKK
jgi:hypothetical protein